MKFFVTLFPTIRQDLIVVGGPPRSSMTSRTPRPRLSICSIRDNAIAGISLLRRSLTNLLSTYTARWRATKLSLGRWPAAPRRPRKPSPLDIMDLAERTEYAVSSSATLTTPRLPGFSSKIGVQDYKALVSEKLRRPATLRIHGVAQFNERRMFVLELVVACSSRST